MNSRKNKKTTVLDGKRFEKVVSRQVNLQRSGYWLKFNLEHFFERTRPTINEWDRLLVCYVDDYREMWPGDRKPLTDYHRYCLAKINKFQNRSHPYKTLEEITKFIERNIKSFSLESYINHYTPKGEQ